MTSLCIALTTTLFLFFLIITCVALPRYSNGMVCYSCDLFSRDCSKIVTCSGGENKCFSIKGDYSLHERCSTWTELLVHYFFFCHVYHNNLFVSFFSESITGIKTKGCGNEIICENNVLNTLGSVVGAQTTCCAGILCNSGQCLKQSLFLLLVPLLSLFSLWHAFGL